MISLLSTCLASTAAVYSLPNVSSVRATSSRIMLKSRARSVSSLRINRLTCWRCVINCEALNLATTLFNTCHTQVTISILSSWHARHTRHTGHYSSNASVNRRALQAKFRPQVPGKSGIPSCHDACTYKFEDCNVLWNGDTRIWISQYDTCACSHRGKNGIHIHV